MTKPIESTLRKNLLRVAVAYAKASGLKLSSISVYAGGDASLLESVGNGSSFSTRTYDKLIRWFSRQDWKGHRMPALTDPKHHQQRKPKPKR